MNTNKVESTNRILNRILNKKLNKKELAFKRYMLRTIRRLPNKRLKESCKGLLFTTLILPKNQRQGWFDLVTSPNIKDILTQWRAG